jgi:hypothetical protein
VNNFYVYAYVRGDRTPYYIGKGQRKRAYSDNRLINKPTDASRIVIIVGGLEENEAYTLEQDLISHYGRQCNGTGILRNIIPGGAGTGSGADHPRFGKKSSKEAVEKMRQSKLGKKHSPESIANMTASRAKGADHHQWGKSPSEETKQKIRVGLMGNKLSPETIAKRAASRKGYKHSLETIEKIRLSNIRTKSERKVAA